MHFQIPQVNFFLLPSPSPYLPSHPLVLYLDCHHYSVLCTLSFLWRIVILIFNRNKHEKLKIYHVFFFTGFKVLIVRIEVRLAFIGLTCFLVLVVCENSNHSPTPRPHCHPCLYSQRPFCTLQKVIQVNATWRKLWRHL